MRRRALTALVLALLAGLVPPATTNAQTAARAPGVQAAAGAPGVQAAALGETATGATGDVPTAGPPSTTGTGTTGTIVIPPPPAPAAPPAPAVAPSAGLQARLARLQEFGQVRPRGDVGLAVIDAAGNVLADTAAERPGVPASTMKLLTAAAALRLLGGQHRFVTRVHTTAPPDASGVVDGDLVLVGGGDPVLHSPRYIRQVYRDRPATRLNHLAAHVARAGVTRVTGRVIADAAILADEPLAEGWRADYLTSLDSSRSAGLTVDAGLRLFRRSGTLHAEAADDPAARAAIELTNLLEDHGVRVDHAPTRRDGTARGGEVARVVSPPLSELLAHMLRTSDNHLADGVFRMLGASTGDPTWAGSAAAVRATFADVDAEWEGLRLADGSGLSRANRLSPAALVRVLHALSAGPLRAQWLEIQAVAGESGTMRARLAGTQAAGRVHAKTGTLRDVRSLAGTVPAPDGADHHFAVITQGLESYADIAAARRLADVTALALVVEQDGCRGRVAVPDRRPGRSPEALLCGARRAS